MVTILHRILFIAGFISVGAAFAAEPTIEEMNREIEKKLADIKIKQRAVEAGSDRALLCSYCHGDNGNSKKPVIPNLAGQNPFYLLDQIDRFSDGRRKNFVMNSLAKSFTAEDKINLAIFYSSMDVKPINIDRQLAKVGRSIFNTKCSSCHGPKGLGNKTFARLAGQQTTYVTNTLFRFRDNARSSDSSRETTRQSSLMESVVKNLTDEQINALAAYVGQLR